MDTFCPKGTALCKLALTHLCIQVTALSAVTHADLHCSLYFYRIAILLVT
jgi:hypothetical protein